MAFARLLTGSAVTTALLLTITATPATAAVPAVPTDLTSHGKPCVTGGDRPWLIESQPSLAADQSDPDDDLSLITRFRWRMLGEAYADGDQLTRNGRNGDRVFVTLPTLQHGQTYAWQARTDDGTAPGDWSAECEFSMDLTNPAPPSAVTSDDYPDDGGWHGGPGIPGVFRVSPPTENPEDVIGYAYGGRSGGHPSTLPFVPAGPDHGAEFTWTPEDDGPNSFYVYTKERTGRFSTRLTVDVRVLPSADPVGSWHFDDATAPGRDVTGHGNTLTLDGASTGTGRGGVGGGLTFDGQDDTAATAGPVTGPLPGSSQPVPLDVTRSLTVSAWIRADAAGAGRQTAVTADGAHGFAFSLGLSDGAWEFAMPESDVDAPVLRSVVSDAPAVIGRWTHVTGTYDVATRALRLRVNGVAQAGTATLAGGFAPSGPVVLGRHLSAGAPAGFLTGALDEVRIAPRLVPAAEDDLAPRAPTVALSAPHAAAGETVTVTLGARGDSNVTHYLYALYGTGDYQQLAPGAQGGEASFQVTADHRGSISIRVKAVDTQGRQSGESRAEVPVGNAFTVAVEVVDIDFLPLSDATVTLHPTGATAVTDAAGQVRFEGVVPGTYHVTTVKDGQCATESPVPLTRDHRFFVLFFGDSCS